MKSLCTPAKTADFAIVTCNDEGDVDLSKTAEVQIITHPASIRVILDPNGENHESSSNNRTITGAFTFTPMAATHLRRQTVREAYGCRKR